jgi:hypothetical protein
MQERSIHKHLIAQKVKRFLKVKVPSFRVIIFSTDKDVQNCDVIFPGLIILESLHFWMILKHSSKDMSPTVTGSCTARE